MNRMQQDAVAQMVWRSKALPVRLGSRVAPRLMTRGIRGASKLHLGCGSNLIRGWANLDMGGPRGVTRLDLKRPLPFDSGSVELIYTEHFVEHVDKGRAASLLKECARVLRPGGTLRVSTPDLAKLVEEYRSGRVSEWADMNWAPATPCDLLNEGMRLWGHMYLWDEPELTWALAAAGFSTTQRVRWGGSRHDALRGLESRPDHGDLIVEATR